MSAATWTRDAILALLDSSDKAVVRAIVVLQSLQTQAERISDATFEPNAQGWNSVDAAFMGSLARGIAKYGSLTPKQMIYARKKVRKYAAQLAKVANKEILAPEVSAMSV